MDSNRDSSDTDKVGNTSITDESSKDDCKSIDSIVKNIQDNE